MNLTSAVGFLFISSAAVASSMNPMVALVQGAAVQSLLYKVYSSGLSTHP